MADRIVVIGGGQAAVSLIGQLRELGCEREIMLIGQENVLPYQRPPLSKKYLTGEFEFERLLLRPEIWYQQQRIEVRKGVRANAIDRASKEVVLATGERVGYDLLALTTGSRPRRLPDAIGGTLSGVYTMRDLVDADAIAPEFQTGRRVLVVGGGYIGLEAAAVASTRGLEVTLIEMGERILQRVAAPLTSDFFRALHAGHGVRIREGVGLERLEGADGHVRQAVLSTGERVDIDCVIVGIGILPNDEVAREAGLALDNGIAVDGHCRSSDPDIFAAGDCASFIWRGKRLRLESVQNAIDQAKAAAATMLGGPDNYVPKPWFWSDQFDIKLQIAGLSTGFDNTVLRQGKRAGAQSVWYYKGDTLLAVDAMNDAPAFLIGRNLVEAGKSIPAGDVANPATNLKDWL